MNTTSLKQDLFFELASEISEEYTINESEEYLEEALSIYEALEEFFVENYHYLSIEEQSYAVMRGIDVNEDVVDILMYALLDESIGSAIATAVYGIGQKVAQVKSNMAARNAEKKTNVATKTAARAGGMVMKAKSAEKKNNNSLSGQFKASFARARAEKVQQKAKTAYAKGAQARNTAQSSADALAAKQKKRQDLASKIDTKVSNAKTAVKSGVKKAVGVLGRVAGRLAG